MPAIASHSVTGLARFKFLPALSVYRVSWFLLRDKALFCSATLLPTKSYANIKGLQ